MIKLYFEMWIKKIISIEVILFQKYYKMIIYFTCENSWKKLIFNKILKNIENFKKYQINTILRYRLLWKKNDQDHLESGW